METNDLKLETLLNLLDYDASKFPNAEFQLKNALNNWINLTYSLKLKAIVRKYLEFVQDHIDKMENFFEGEQIKSLSLHNGVIQALIEEVQEKLSYCSHDQIRDAALLAVIQEINHFKISAYGTAAAFANTLGMEKHASMFYEFEVNEKHIDDRLSQLAQFEINVNAKSPGSLLK